MSDDAAELTRSAHPDWEWDIGKGKLGNAPLHGTYLVGYPKTPRGAA